MNFCKHILADHHGLRYGYFKVGLAVVLAISFNHLPAQNTGTTPGRAECIAGKPIGFYLNHKAIDRNSKLFYEGKWRADDNEKTFAMLDSVLTRNAETRPFYFYILSQVMTITDGALSEYVTGVCTRYFSRYPCELMANQADAIYRTNLHQWAEFIAYDVYLTEAFRKYSGALETQACRSKTLTAFLDDIEKIIAGISAH